MPDTEAKPLVIYHGNCADGFSAAWCFWRYHRDTADYVAGVYQTPPPDVTGRDVYLVDFSYKRAVVADMLTKAARVTLIDHHKTAIEDLAGLDNGGNDGGGPDAEAAGSDGHQAQGINAQLHGIIRIDFHIDVLRIELAQHIGLAGAGLGVPLRGSATAGQEDEGIGFVGGFGHGAGGLEDEFGPAIRSEELAIAEEPSL